MNTIDNATMSRAAAVVAGLYDAFLRHDVPALLGTLAEDVSWDADWPADYTPQQAGVAHLAPRHGPQGVADFLAWFATTEIHDFHISRIFGDDTHAVACLTADFTAPGMDRIRDEEIHLWTVRPDGKIAAMRHYVDTAKHIAAARAAD